MPRRLHWSSIALSVALSSLSSLASAAPSAQDVARHYAAIVFASYTDTLAATLDLQRAINTFVERPSAAGLRTARERWLLARNWYGQTEAYRFYGGPIDGRDGPEPRINSWPVDESYIDTVRGRPDSGIVNDASVRIRIASLIKLNARGGQENVATGWHAIEFLLWGQDFNADGPGSRSYEDFMDGRAPNAARRRQYLAVITALLGQDLAHVTNAWHPAQYNYRFKFERSGVEALRQMLVGLGSLARGELAGERMEVALATQDQEDEQSCFSDNTHNDIIANALSLENVWHGRYRRRDGTLLEGPSLRDLVASANLDSATAVDRDLVEALAAAQALHPPFDQEILGDDEAEGRKRVRAVIVAVKKFSDDLVRSANAIGITRLTLVRPKT